MLFKIDMSVQWQFWGTENRIIVHYVYVVEKFLSILDILNMPQVTGSVKT